jgi:hypothetical protein
LGLTVYVTRFVRCSASAAWLFDSAPQHFGNALVVMLGGQRAQSLADFGVLLRDGGVNLAVPNPLQGGTLQRF